MYTVMNYTILIDLNANFCYLVNKLKCIWL